MPPEVRIGFWGTPAIAADLLTCLAQDPRFRIVMVVTQPDKPRSSRGQQILPSPVKAVALANGIPVLQPENLRDKKDTIISLTAESRPDFHVVLAYGGMIPASVFNQPRLGSVNFHASRLPLLRGASPIESAILHGFSVTGWTLQRITKRLDAGDIFAASSISIDAEDDSLSLASRLRADLLLNAPDWLASYAAGELTPVVQDEGAATYCHKFENQSGALRLTESAAYTLRLERALVARGGIFAHLNGKKVRLFAAPALPQPDLPPDPGRLYASNGRLWFSVSDAWLELHEIQPEGKKRLAIRDFLNGYRMAPGERLEPAAL